MQVDQGPSKRALEAFHSFILTNIFPRMTDEQKRRIVEKEGRENVADRRLQSRAKAGT